MQCPRCGKELVREKYESVTVDACLACGAWLDSGELERVIQDREQAFAAAQIEEALKANSASLGAEKAPHKTPCPRCGSCMDTFNYNYDTGIVLDSCPYGHGVWLDKGELERVQIHMEHWDRQAPAKKPEWQELMKKKEQELAEREAHARQAR